MASGDGGQDGGDLIGATIGSGGGAGEQQAQGGGGQADANAGAGGGDAAAGDASWFDKLSTSADGDKPSNRDWVASKGFKDPDALIRSYRDAEGTIRGNGAIRVPGDGAKPEEVAAFNKAIGVPDDVKGYEVAAPEGVAMNEPLIEGLRASALKNGMPAGAFKGVVGDFIKLQMDEAAQTAKAQNEGVEAKVREWGAKEAEQRAHVNAAGRALGLDAEDVRFLYGIKGGPGRALDLLAKLGSGMAEDVLITGGKGRFGVSPAEAKAEMDQLKADPEFVRKAQVKGSPEQQRWNRLNGAVADAAGRQAA